MIIDLAIFIPMAFMAIVWIGWDLLVLMKVINQKLISVQIWDLSLDYPIIPSLVCLLIGILIGHFEWQMPNSICK